MTKCHLRLSEDCCKRTVPVVKSELSTLMQKALESSAKCSIGEESRGHDVFFEFIEHPLLILLS